MRSDPARPHLEVDTPLWILDLDNVDLAFDADFIILMVDPAESDYSRERELARTFSNKGKKILIFLNQLGETDKMMVVNPESEWGKRRVVCGAVDDTDFLLEKFAPVVISLIPGKLLSLGRYFPLFRVPIAHYLINDNCVTNAAYALSTGLAETIPIFSIPIAVADTVILTKNQAYLAYKLGLALGYSTRWQDYIAEFGGVLGGGFVWRQIARTLVSFIPVWGIIPKTAIAYAGTYVVGHAILQWYLTGRHLSRKQLRGVYSRALARGKEVGLNMVSRLPRPKKPRIRLPRLKIPKLKRIPLFRRKQPALPAPENSRVCSNCGKVSAADAKFCQYCGDALVTEMGDAA